MELLLTYIKEYSTHTSPISLVNTVHKHIEVINEITLLTNNNLIEKEIVDYDKIHTTIEAILEMNSLKTSDSSLIDVIYYPEDKTDDGFNFTLIYPKSKKK